MAAMRDYMHRTVDFSMKNQKKRKKSQGGEYIQSNFGKEGSAWR